MKSPPSTFSFIRGATLAGIGFSMLAIAGVSAQDGKSEAATDAGIKNPKKLKAKIKQVKGLLVNDLGNDLAGMASIMTVTASSSGSGDDFEIRFNQKVGSDMRTALSSVQRALEVRYDSLPKGYKATLSFQDKYTPKDGPSAAVACALLVDGLITGNEYDSAFAVTGDMNADMSVQPVGGVDAKIRGAARKKCNVVAIPKINASTITDLAVLGEYKPIYAIQVFTIEKYDDALTLALKNRSADLNKSIEEFASVQKALKRKGEKLLRNRQVQARLRGIIKRTPNHLSARTLLLAGINRLPRSLSLKGSFVQMSRASAPFFQALDSDSGLDEKIFAETAFKMNKLRSRLDKRTVKYQDSITDLVNLWRSYADRDVKGRQQFKTAREKFDSAYKRVKREAEALHRNREIAEELME